MDLSLLHTCAFVSLVTELSCALDHSCIAFALAQVVPQNRVTFDMVAERREATPRVELLEEPEAKHGTAAAAAAAAAPAVL